MNPPGTYTLEPITPPMGVPPCQTYGASVRLAQRLLFGSHSLTVPIGVNLRLPFGLVPTRLPPMAKSRVSPFALATAASIGVLRWVGRSV